MSKSVSLNLPQVKSLMHYFGYEYIAIHDGTWKFQSKSFPGNFCYIKQMFGASYIAGIEFRNQIARQNVREGAAKVKEWKGLFTAIRTHTKTLIFRREVMNQHLKQAA